MRVLQCRSRLCDMPVPGAVFQPRAPDPTGQDANKGKHGGEHRKKGAQTAAGKAERERGAMDEASVNGDRGDGERGGQIGRRQVSGDTTGGQRGDGGRHSGISTHPGGPTSPGGLRRLGSCQSRHAPGQRRPRQLGVAGVAA